MTVRRSGKRVPTTAMDEIVAATDEKVGTTDDPTELMLQQTFATVWAVLGLVLWTMLKYNYLALRWVWRLLTRRNRPSDEGWTTTMRYRGRAVK